MNNLVIDERDVGDVTDLMKNSGKLELLAESVNDIYRELMTYKMVDNKCLEKLDDVYTALSNVAVILSKKAEEKFR